MTQRNPAALGFGSGAGRVAVAMAILAIALATVDAAAPPRSSFAAQVAGADFVFQGVVRDVHYAQSTPAGPDDSPMPHTFVMFDIERVLRGRFGGDTITLRFFGGMSEDGRFFTSSINPLFDVGERSILLVRNNGIASCPLVGARYGRFRIVDGLVYNDFGQAVNFGTDGGLRFGPAERLEQVERHRIAGTPYDFDVETIGANDTRPDDRADFAGPGSGDDRRAEAVTFPTPVTAAEFAAAIVRLARQAPTQPGTDPTVRDLTSAVPFDGPEARRVENTTATSAAR